MAEESNWLKFETLTLVPYDRALIVPSMLTKEQTTFINEYYTRIRKEVGPEL
jgi:Xaa-Pro aminopeptidase